MTSTPRRSLRLGRPLWAGLLSLPAALVLSACAGTTGTGIGGAGPVAPAPPSLPPERGWVAVISGKDAPVPQIPMGDPTVVEAIIAEGQLRGQVMTHLSELLRDDLSPRLTGSQRIARAGEWIRQRYIAWGLDAPRHEPWGTIGVGFDRGPSSAKVLLPPPPSPRRPRRADEPAGAASAASPAEVVRELQFSTLSWSAGTNGPVRGRIVRLPESAEALKAAAESIRGAWVLVPTPPAGGQRGVRSRLSTFVEQRRDARTRSARGEDLASLSLVAQASLMGPAGFISSSGDERVWTGAVPGWRTLTADTIDPDIHLSVRQSDYDYINSHLLDGDALELEADLKHTFTPGPVTVVNTIAEIRGTDLADEVVFVTGHLDSWDGPGSRGATDNGTGTAVTMEAARILAAVLRDAPPASRPRRTIRFVHWTGEEQGLLGSREYVRQNESQHAKWSGCFVDDGGTDTQGGLPAADAMVPYLAAATAPVNYRFWSEIDGKWLNVNIRPTGPRLRGSGGSDHASFNAVGVPGFFWDEVGRADYGYGWHTQHDNIDLAIPEYLTQSAVCSAVTAYRLACAPELLPRSAPAPAPGGEGATDRPPAGRPAGAPEPPAPPAGTPR